MSIWFKKFDLETINARGKGTMVEYLGIVFTNIDDTRLTAIMPVTARVKQPVGIVHGGANIVLAETIASTAANMVVDIEKEYCVGLEINANHLRSVREGVVKGIAQPIHLGKSTQVWQIDLYDENEKKTCSSRMTAAVLQRA